MLEIWASVEGRMLNLHRKRERFEHEIVVILEYYVILDMENFSMTHLTKRMLVGLTLLVKVSLRISINNNPSGLS